MKKILHTKQFIAKNHYFLPQDDQSDPQDNQQKQSFNQNISKSKIQIENFTQIGNIKINIQINNQNFSQLKVTSKPGKWSKPIKTNQNQSKQRIFSIQRPYETEEKKNPFYISTQNNQQSQTPVKNPVFHYGNNKSSNFSSQTIRPFSKFVYNYECPFRDQLIQENVFQTDKKNKRYYNTQIFGSSWVKSKMCPQIPNDQFSNLQKTNDNSPQKATHFISSSVSMNHLAQKPFFSASKEKNAQKTFENRQQQNQEELYFKKEQFDEKIRIREQISQDYVSGHNSRKRFEWMKQGFYQREIQSQIYLQNQHQEEVNNQETVPEIEIEEFIFGDSYNRKNDRNQQSVSEICEQNQLNEKHINPIENEVQKNFVKIQTKEEDQQFIKEDVYKFQSYFQKCIQRESPQIKQKQQIIMPLSFDQSKQEKQHQKLKQKQKENIQLVDNLQIYCFNDSQKSLQLEQNQIQSYQISSHQYSNKSDQHRQMDEMSEIQKLRESQIQAFSLQIDHNKQFQSHIQNPNQLQIYQSVEEFQKVQDQDHKFSEKNHCNQQNQQKHENSVIIQSQEQSIKSYKEIQLAFTFAPAKQAQLILIQSSENQQQMPTKIKQQFRKEQEFISPKLQKNKQIKLSRRINSEQGYYQKKSRSKSKENPIPFSNKSKPHHHKKHCFQPTQPRPFIFKDYSKSNRESKIHESQRKSSRSYIDQQQKINKISPQKQPKIVKINLANKKAQDLFTKHKNQFLNKLKFKQNFLNQQMSTQQKSKEKSTKRNPNLSKDPNNMTQSIRKNRPVSPFIQELSQRLHSQTSESLCEHYRKHSKRNLRQKFFTIISEDRESLLNHYYFSSEQLHQIFIDKILNKELNEKYWIEIVKKEGQKKLKNMRIRSKSKYHPNQRSVVRKQQIAADSKRAYPFASPILKHSFQKIQTY